MDIHPFLIANSTHVVIISVCPWILIASDSQVARALVNLIGNVIVVVGVARLMIGRVDEALTLAKAAELLSLKLT